MTPVEYLFLFGSILLSGLAFFVIRRTDDTVLKLALSFTGAFLFAISVIHLIPSVYREGGESIGLYVLGGFFIQVIIEYFSEGIEHGHMHKHHAHEKSFPMAMMLGLSVHSFLEGMPLAGGASFSGGHHHPLLSGIVLHHIPVAFALTSMLVASGLSRPRVVAWLVVFAAMAPLGSLSGQWVNEAFFREAAVYFNRLMAIVIGIFLHISTTILFESNESHRFNLYKLVVILAGAAVAGLVF